MKLYRVFTLCLALSFFFCHSTALAASGAEGQEGRVLAAQPPQEQRIAPEAFFALMLMNAERGQSQAMLNLGLLYEQGLGVARNFTKALEWYQKAGNAGEGEGYMRAGQCYEIGIGTTADMTKAVAVYEKAVALGHVPAMSRLAEVFLNGRGAPRDENRGFALLNRAADAGDGAAMFDMGHKGADQNGAAS